MDITFDARWIPGIVCFLISIPHLAVGGLLLQLAEKRENEKRPTAGVWATGALTLVACVVYFILGIVGTCNAAGSIYGW